MLYGNLFLRIRAVNPALILCQQKVLLETMSRRETIAILTPPYQAAASQSEQELSQSPEQSTSQQDLPSPAQTQLASGMDPVAAQAHLSRTYEPATSALSEDNRRDERQPEDRTLGKVIAVDGAYATLMSYVVDSSQQPSDFWTVGRLITIHTVDGRVVGLVYKINSADKGWQETNNIEVHVELVGEIRQLADGTDVFSRGIITYPPLGSIAHQIRANDLSVIHHPYGRKAVEIGKLSQDETVPAVVCMEDMLQRHFAIVGSTGTGKSTSVALLVRKIVESSPKLRVLILDPHNEYAKAFPDQCVSISTDTLELPFWLFQHEELCEVIFRGRDNFEEEIDVLRDLIPVAKTRYSQKINHTHPSILKRTSGGPAMTADTPVPYRMTDLFQLIDDEIGQLEGSHSRMILKSLKNRLDALVNDPRYKFMFSQRTVSDNMSAVIGKIFRIPLNDRPITSFQLIGLPSDVVNSVVSVLCRMAFDLAVWSAGACEVLVLCEEAHRYVPMDKGQGFGPTRRSISRIAKEGRKYGSYLGIVTQRPSELDPTILSQCSTIFAMRLSNDRDQTIIRSAISDSAASTLSFLSSIGNREAIAFGEGVSTPMRMRFENQPAKFIPGATKDEKPQDPSGKPAEPDLDAIIDSMRNIQGRG